MDTHEFLINVLIYLGSAIFIVPIFKRLGFGAVLGYLCAGMLIGPHILSLISDVDTVLHFSEFGVILLLFVIGLELSPSRLKAFRKKLLVAGSQQFLSSALVLFAALYWLMGLSWRVALAVALAVSLSSTAFALQSLVERKELTTGHGRLAFAILLFQDLAVIPLLALLPILSQGLADQSVLDLLKQIGLAVGVILAVVVAGHYLLFPILRLVAKSQVRELFTATALGLATGTALLLEQVGLSMALGSFLAGVLLADSEYRHALEADIEPFKGLLLGLFFIAVGMSVDLELLFAQPLQILALAMGLIGVKATILYVTGRLNRLNREASMQLALVMPQGGEFAFVILGVALGVGLMDDHVRAVAIVVVTISMALTPLLYSMYSYWSKRHETPMPPPDEVEGVERSVIIAGFGRFAQIVARILLVEKIPITALEKRPEQVDFVRRFGTKVYYGDSTQPELLRAAKADEAAAFVLAIEDDAESIKTAKLVKQMFPDLPILARARNRQHAFRLMDVGVDYVIRETYLSSLELTRQLLTNLGRDKDNAQRSVEKFREHDEALLKRQQTIHNDEQALIQSAVEAREELQRLFDADQQETE